MADKIKWCLKQKKGIELIQPKPHLSDAYINEADETLENISVARGKWKIIMAYYACYNALYAILMKCGVKCEIHDCTIELMHIFDFNESEIDFVRELKSSRIKVQYYLKEVALGNEMLIKKFVLKCKTILQSLSAADIERIRRALND